MPEGIVHSQTHGTSCGLSQCQRGMCPACRRNRWIDEHTCEWCDTEVQKAAVVKGHVLCGEPNCEWLLFEALARRKAVG